MAEYTLRQTGVKQNSTGFIIPDAPGNRHWQEYQKWLAAGNVPDPFVPKSVFVPPTKAEELALKLEQPEIKNLVKVLAERFGVTAKQLEDEIKAKGV